MPGSYTGVSELWGELKLSFCKIGTGMGRNLASSMKSKSPANALAGLP